MNLTSIILHLMSMIVVEPNFLEFSLVVVSKVFFAKDIRAKLVRKLTFRFLTKMDKKSLK